MSLKPKSDLASYVSSADGIFARRLGEGLLVIDSRHKVQSLSKVAAGLVGLQAAEALNQDATLLPTSLQRVVDRVFTTGKPVENRQITLPSASGKVHATVNALPLQAGKARSGVAIVIVPRNPAENFEQNIRRLERLANVGMLSAGMAHEIKNALVSVKTFIDLLLDRNQDAELADVVGREMRRINALVSQTLKFSGPSRPSFSTVRLHDVLDHSLRMVQPQVRTKAIALKRSFQATPGVVRGDDYQLEQVFLNLFLNAVEAMGTAGSLTIATETVTDHAPGVRVTITDTGAGIPPENMSRLFEPFFTTKTEGTGLGLAIARRIVQEHTGTIEARSEINKGTTVSVVLPSHTAE